MGGGAKGAFQAGVLYALYKRGINIKVIGGTSIGAINGYFAFHREYEKMKALYLDEFDENFMDREISGRTIDNNIVKDIFVNLKGNENSKIEAFYINYMPVKNGQVSEVIEDIKGTEKMYGIERVLWSSRLPYNNPRMTYREFIDYMAKVDIAQKFQMDLVNHVYDGINLDGGFINNSFIYDILKHEIDKLIILGYNGSKEEYLNSLKEEITLNEEDIIYVSSKNPFKITDTYEFNKEFLTKRFNEGYEEGMTIKL